MKMFNLTKDEALQILENGGKIAHRSFTSDEWMKKAPNRTNSYIFEDGCICSARDFWRYRSDQDGWDTGWKEVQKPASWIGDMSGSINASYKYKKKEA